MDIFFVYFETCWSLTVSALSIQTLSVIIGQSSSNLITDSASSIFHDVIQTATQKVTQFLCTPLHQHNNMR